jgi:hypothetical protein
MMWSKLGLREPLALRAVTPWRTLGHVTTLTTALVVPATMAATALVKVIAMSLVMVTCDV